MNSQFGEKISHIRGTLSLIKYGKNANSCFPAVFEAPDSPVAVRSSDSFSPLSHLCVCIFVCLCLCAHVCEHLCVGLCVCLCVSSCASTRVCAHVCVSACVFVCVCMSA